jgi:threonine/homoserine/homoserine lactone efflux protein
VSEQFWVRLAGGAFLVYLGIRIFSSTPSDVDAQKANHSLAKDYGSTLALTLTNPLTIIPFAAVFTGLNLAGGNGNYVAAPVLVSGVFAGSVLWWVVLSTSVGAVRTKVGPRTLKWINRLSGVTITAFGVGTFLTLLL